jgi:hypothetical protein
MGPSLTGEEGVVPNGTQGERRGEEESEERTKRTTEPETASPLPSKRHNLP